MPDTLAPAFAYADLLKLLLALGLTIALFLVLVVAMKKMQLGAGRANQLITVLAALPLGGKEKIWLLEIDGERIVVGSGQGGVNRIHVLTGVEPASGAGKVAATAAFPEAPREQAAPSFAATLLSAIGKGRSQ